MLNNQIYGRMIRPISAISLSQLGAQNFIDKPLTENYLLGGNQTGTYKKLRVLIYSIQALELDMRISLFSF